MLQPLRRPLMEGPVLIEATAQRPCRTRREFRMTRFVSHYQVVLGHAASTGHSELEREKVQPGYGLKHGHGNGALPDSGRARCRADAAIAVGAATVRSSIHRIDHGFGWLPVA